VDASIPAKTNEVAAEFRLEIPDAVFLIGLAGTTEIVQMITVFGPPLEDVPRQDLIRDVGTEVSIHPSVPPEYDLPIK